ncbi:MAG: immunoglobulin domain-containing protein [Verrucomicrobia bacterium]|nr:immunoglobulin domain-containing protein [Verrucomicrobiota bacterium]
MSSVTIDDTNNLEFGSSVAALDDGLIYSANGAGNTDWTLTPAAGSLVTINLNTTASVKGYDLSSIVSLTGTAQNRAQQAYDVAVRQVGSSTFTPLYSVPPVGSTAQNVECQVVATNATALPMATNVVAIQLTFNAVPWSGGGLQGSMYREFDVYGGPSGALPTISAAGQPQNQAVVIGGTATFTVSAQSTAGPMSYQWQINVGGNWTDLAGATTATLNVSQVTTNNSGSRYRVLVSNVNGTTASQPATLTVGAAAEVGQELLPGIVIQGTVGLKYRVDYTLSLTPPVDWQPLATVTLSTSPYVYVDTQNGGQQRFYRAVLLP